MAVKSVNRRLRRGLALLLAAAGLANSAPGKAWAEITYEQILQAPDDINLNLQYARQEIRTGRLQQAAAALERILLHRPNWDAVRLFYGIVLYRLDDMHGARRELNLLEGRSLTPRQEADRAKYLALANKKSQSVRVTGRVSLGGRYDSNPGLVADSITDSSDISSDDADGAVVASGRIRVEADLENGRGDFLYFEANGYVRDFFEIDSADNAQARVKSGARFHGENGFIAPYASYSSGWVQYEDFRQTYGGGVDVRLSLSSQVALIVNGQSRREDYSKTSFSSVGSQRDGVRNAGGAYLQWRPSDATTVTFGGRIARKNAKNDGFSYDSGRIALRTYSLLGKGRYVSTATSFTRNDYDQPDGFYSNTVARKDDIFRFRVAAGAPMGTLFGDAQLPEGMSDVVAQIGGTYWHQESNISQLDIDNVSIDLMFTKPFSY